MKISEKTKKQNKTKPKTNLYGKKGLVGTKSPGRVTDNVYTFRRVLLRFGSDEPPRSNGREPEVQEGKGQVPAVTEPDEATRNVGTARV